MISNSEDSRLHGRGENAHRRYDQLIDIMEQAGAEWNREHPMSRSSLSGKPRRTQNLLVSRTDVYNIVKILMQEGSSKLDDWVIDNVKQKVIDALETCDIDHNKAFIKAAMRSALKELLVSILDAWSSFKESP